MNGSRLLTKLLEGSLTLFFVMTLTFFLLRVLPGGPFDQDRKLPPQIEANMKAKFHLDQPVYAQYGYYVLGVFKGDLGPSYKFMTRNVTDIVVEATGVSVLLGSLALILGLGLGVILGTWAGVSSSKTLDTLISLLGTVCLSTPSFIFAAMLVLLFSYSLHWLPAARLVSPAHLVLPVLALALTPFAYSTLLIRTAVRETQAALFVKIKHSYGLAPLRITIKHVLRNALPPFISILGPLCAAVVTGSFAIELIFALPGLGKYFVNAVINRDYTLVMGITLVYSVFLIIFNLLTDILAGLVDPRLQETQVS